MSPKPLFAFQRTKDKALLAGVLAVPKLDLDLDTPSDQELVRSLATLLVKRSHDGRLPEHPVFVWPDGSLSPDFGSDGEGKWLNACTAVGILVHAVDFDQENETYQVELEAHVLQRTEH
jgi:hypothetical protein